MALKRLKKYLVIHHALPSAPKIVSDLSALAYHGMIGNTIQSLIENGSDFFKINLDFYVFIKKIPYTSGLTKRILTSPIKYLKSTWAESILVLFCTGLISKPQLIVIGFIKIREMKQHLWIRDAEHYEKY